VIDPVPVDDPDTLRVIFANTDALLLDFDGPVCRRRAAATKLSQFTVSRRCGRNARA
jgi:hypothetical protein